MDRSLLLARVPGAALAAAALLGMPILTDAPRPRDPSARCPATTVLELDLPRPPAACAGDPFDGASRSSRAALERALPYLERDGRAWIAERNCVSCHQIPSMIWSRGAAARAGVGTPPDDALLAWSFEFVARPDVKNDAGIAQLIVAVGDDLPEDARRHVDTLVAKLGRTQREDGSWRGRGQLPDQRRPQRETDDVFTVWTWLALERAAPGSETTTRARDQVRRQLDPSGTPPVSVEALATRAIAARRLDVERRVWRSRLLEARNDDGGWAWRIGESSDPYGTGVALFALVEAGVPVNHGAVRDGATWLVERQECDGSWPTPGTLVESERRAVPTSTYWGSGWATIGLSTVIAAGSGETYASTIW